MLLITGSIVSGQEPKLPAVSDTPASETAPEISPTAPPALPTPLPNLAPLPLPTIPVIPGISQLDEAFKKSPLGKAAEDYRLHVEWRKLQNEAASDPRVLAASASAAAARTDLEKRKRLRVYYDVYYGLMRSRASTPELKAYIDAQKAAHLGTTAQDRVRPGGTPPPTGATPRPTPTPSPTKAPKAKSAF